MVIMPEPINFITIVENIVSMIFECFRLEWLKLLSLPFYVEL